MAILAQNKPYTLAEANKAAGNVETANLLSDFSQRNSFLDLISYLNKEYQSLVMIGVFYYIVIEKSGFMLNDCQIAYAVCRCHVDTAGGCL